MKKQTVKITQSFGVYNSGEFAAFTSEKAEELLQRNLVCFVDVDGKIVKKNLHQSQSESMNAALKKERKEEEDLRLMEQTRRFFIDFSLTENGVKKVMEFIEREDEQGLIQFALQSGFIGVNFDRFERIAEERKALKKVQSEASKVRRRAKDDDKKERKAKK